jgi:hypothetical protein
MYTRQVDETTSQVDESYSDWYGAGEAYESYGEATAPYGVESDVEWAEYSDEHGTVYWYNNYTGESTYENPFAAVPFDASTYSDPEAHRRADPVQDYSYESRGACAASLSLCVVRVAGPPGWTSYHDEEGTPYWYNNVTGESTYDTPSDGQETGSAWEMLQDDQGFDYWYNTVSGESTYDNPLDSAAMSDSDEAWAQYQGEDGSYFWYNSITGESSYGAGDSAV